MNKSEKNIKQILKNSSPQANMGGKMKIKVLFGVLFVFAITSCGVSINGKEVAHVDPVLQSTVEAKMCNIDMVFYEGYDSTRDRDYFYQLDISNYEYRYAEVRGYFEDGGTAFHAQLGEEQEDTMLNVNIDNGEKITVKVMRPNESGVMTECADSPQKFKLEIK